jgi:hypothetical protein
MLPAVRSSDGAVLVGIVSTEMDATGQSYYGSTSMLLLHSDGSFDCNVAPPKEGGIHDVQWSPASAASGSSAPKRLAVCAGTMPTQTALYNAKGEQQFQFGNAHRNVLSWSPHGRFLCIAGFGNLAGHMDFWDCRKLKVRNHLLSHVILNALFTLASEPSQHRHEKYLQLCSTACSITMFIIHAHAAAGQQHEPLRSQVRLVPKQPLVHDSNVRPSHECRQLFPAVQVQRCRPCRQQTSGAAL